MEKRKRDFRTPAKRAADCHAWYLRNKAYVKMKTGLYRKTIRNDPILWETYLAKARVYKRKRFGWKRIYRRRAEMGLCLVTSKMPSCKI